jgi:N-acyl-D-aspartate/D-glutamate deacylase
MSEPVLLSIAVAVATKAVKGLYELVKEKFADDPVASEVLETAENAAAEGADSPEVVELSEALEQAELQDPAFREQLRAHWEHTVNVTQEGRVTNQLTGNVSGRVVQAGDIHGGVRF